MSFSVTAIVHITVFVFTFIPLQSLSHIQNMHWKSLQFVRETSGTPPLLAVVHKGLVAQEAPSASPPQRPGEATRSKHPRYLPARVIESTKLLGRNHSDLTCRKDNDKTG